MIILNMLSRTYELLGVLYDELPTTAYGHRSVIDVQVGRREAARISAVENDVMLESQFGCAIFLFVPRHATGEDSWCT